MPIQCAITLPSGVVTNYHIVRNSTSNFVLGGTNNASVDIDSFLDSTHGNDPTQVPLASMTLDISPLVLSAVVAAPSILAIIEGYLLTTPTFTGGTQVA